MPDDQTAVLGNAILKSRSSASVGAEPIPGLIKLGTIPEGAVAASGICRGTAGELYQGPFEHDGKLETAIVSAPLNRFTCVHFVPHEFADGEADRGRPSGREVLDNRPRMRRAVEAFCRIFDRPAPLGDWRLSSELVIGAGMASSTADIVAILRCLANSYEVTLTSSIVSRILSEIEYSDSVFLDYYTVFLSERHAVAVPLGRRVRLWVAYLLEDYSVDTAQDREQLHRYYHRHRDVYRTILDDLVTAFRSGDVSAVCALSGKSAELSQGVRPKQTFEALDRRRRACGADGIIVAHTGSLIGYLYGRRPDRHAVERAATLFDGLGHRCFVGEIVNDL